MAKITVLNHLSLDGVMQAPGAANEDRRGGFEHGGWEPPYGDKVMAEFMGRRMSKGGALLLGRRTYENFAATWPKLKDNPFTEVLNNLQKYVVSRKLKGPLSWVNSTLLKGEAEKSVAKLKATSKEDLLIMGSGVLVQSLLNSGLIDTFILSIHPLVLGSGRHLFEDGGSYASLRLVDSETTTTGVMIATFEPGEPPAVAA
jgi:dihydrofolate reductase